MEENYKKLFWNSLCTWYAKTRYICKRVLEKFGVESVTPYSKCFGAWEWNIELDDTFDFNSFSSWMKREMDRLYNTGNIRGA